MLELPEPDAVETLELPDPDPVQGPESKIKRFGKQALAGLLGSPAVIPGLYALLNKGVSVPGGDAAQKAAEDIQGWANETAGTGPIENTSDAIASVLGSIAVPVPGSTVSAVVKAVPGLAKLITAAPKTANVLGNVAEVLTPTTVKPSASRYAANAVVGAGVHEGMNAYTGDPDYKSQLPDMGQDRIALALPDPDPITPLALPDNDVETKDDWSGLKTVAGLGAVATGAWYLMRRSPRKMLRSDTIAAPDPLKAPFETATTPAESLRTQGQDATAVLKSQVLRATADDVDPAVVEAGKQFARNIDLQTRSGGASVIESIMKSGIYPGGKVRGPSMLSNELEFQQFDAAKQKLISDGMIAQDLIESRALMRATQKPAAGVQGPPVPLSTNLPGFDDVAVDAMAAALKADPQAYVYAIKLRQSMRDALTFARDEGRIDEKAFQTLLKNRQNYVPMRRAGEDMSESQFDALLKRTDDPSMGAQEVLNPIQSAESYVAELTRRVMNNSVRRDFIDMMATSNKAALEGSLRQVKEGTADTITIYRNGVAEHYEFADPLVKEALKLNPIMAHGVAAATRSIYQQNTTGVLAPLKSIRAMIWDAVAATNYREGGRQFGLLDQAVQAASGGNLAFRGDLLGAIPSMAMGVGRTAGARIAASISESIEADLRSGSGMWNNLPKPVATMVSTRMRDAYLNSVWHAFESHGGKNAALLNDDMLQASQMLKGATDRLKNTAFGRALGDTGLARLWRFYTTALDTLQNSVKVQYVAENMGRAPVSQLVHEARSVGGGDMSVRGLGRVKGAETTNPGPYNALDKTIRFAGAGSKLATDWLPYANATLQGLTKLGEVARRDKMNFVAGLAGSIGSIAAASAILNSGMTPEQREAYWSMPSWWRMSRISLPVGDRFEDRIEIPVPPEFTPMIAMVQNGVDQLLGLSNGQAAGLGPDMWQALVDTVGIPLPPLFNAALSAAGGKIGSGMQVQTIPQSRVVPGYQHEGSVMHVNMQEALASILSSSARMLTETANAFHTQPGDEGASAAVSQLTGDTLRNVPVFGSLWGGALDYSSNEVSQGLSKKMDALERIDNQLKGSMQKNQIVPVPSTSSNPAFNARAMQVQMYLMENPAVRDLKEKVKSAQNQIEGLSAIYPKTPDILGQVSGLKRELRNMRDKLGRQISDMESSVGSSLEDLIP